MAFSDSLLKAINSSGIKKSSISFIGSHGQTVWHSPNPQKIRTDKQFSTGSTIQLGSPSVMAVRTGIPVVAHFRDKDVALKGQGAPLAPILHFELFRQYAPAVVLNIGGISNITAIPSHSNFYTVHGFDTGPGNRLIDIAVEAYTKGRKTFDTNGRFAAKGIVNTDMLERLMQDRFVKKHPPKSTGRDLYNKMYMTMLDIPLDDIDTIATLTAFTAPLIRVKGFYIYNVLLKAHSSKTMSDVLHTLNKNLKRTIGDIITTFDVDPQHFV